ncbi:MAG: SGNH/GDSL hydrolase family protein [Lachnospiraceae bacterium]|nr:SGNH/GDSL hydrolase family protein [Lachnospiraceae bacterium]
MDNELRYRESIEWQNIWWEQANNPDIDRIALLGDSVTRGYRSRLNKQLGGKCVVDLCASSSQITDSLLWKEYKFFLDCNEWKYNKIVLHAGGQHGHEIRCCESEVYSGLFKSSYKDLIEKLILYCSDILVVSSTPCVEKTNLTKWDTYRNKELEKRNQLTKEAAEELKLIYIDIWTPLIEADYEYSDYIHVKEEGNGFIAGYLYEYLGQ